MTLSTRDRRALLLLAFASLVLVVVRIAFLGSSQKTVEATQDSIPKVRNRLEKARSAAAGLKPAEAALKDLSAQLAGREKGMIQADTLPQAQAQVVQIVRRVAEAQSPVIEIRSTELGQTKPLGEQYAEVQIPVYFQCRIEQLVNLMADFTTQPEMLATSDLRIGTANAKDKTITVRLTVSGVVPRKLAPQKKGGSPL